jgi:hypothetical protein
LVLAKQDVFQLSSGFASLAWRMARQLYKRGSSGGAPGVLYDRLRSNTDYNRNNLQMRLLSRDLRRQNLNAGEPLVVAHPSLVGMFRGKADLIYQHGELVVPKEAMVAGATSVLVPTDGAAGPFIKCGYQQTQVQVTGLCVEPALCEQAADAALARFHRIEGRDRLTGAYMSSGAEPAQHVTKIIASITSTLRSDGRAIMLAKKGGLLAKRAMARLTRQGTDFQLCESPADLPEILPSLLLAVYHTRRREDDFTARLFAQFDYLVAPAHERTNWALGLGLPMFVLTPVIGSFAPLNLRLLEERGVALRLESPQDALHLGDTLARLRGDGTLLQMAQAGWGRHDIRGFFNIAEFLLEQYGR